MFIAFEGIEGSGKGTAIAKTAALLAALGYETVLTREPGGSRLGASLRAMLLDAKNTDIAPEAELFLYLADRAQHVRQVIRPALEQGKVVISDRFADSTIVYQGFARGLSIPALFQLNDFAVQGLWPDLTLVLDLDPKVGLERAIKRNQEMGMAEAEGRFEAESTAFHTKVREGYLAWSREHPERIKIIDASGGEDEVFARVEAVLHTKLG